MIPRLGVILFTTHLEVDFDRPDTARFAITTELRGASLLMVCVPENGGV